MGLAAARAGDPLSWDIASWLAAALLLALALAVSAWLVARVVPMPLRGLPLLRRLYSPQFSVSPFEWLVAPEEQPTDGDSDETDSFGGGIAALIRQQVRQVPGDPRLDRPGELALVSFSAQHPLESDYDVVAEGPQGWLLGALLHIWRVIAPRERFTLDGTVLPAGDNGPGLTLTLSRRKGQVVAATTVREQTYDPWRHATEPGGEPRSLVTRYYLLAEVAASWTQFHLVVHYTSRRYHVLRRLAYQDPVTPDRLKARTDAERAFATLGTHDDQSYALLRAGLYWQRRDDWYRARSLYIKALARDPENVLASFQLGVIEIFLNRREAAIRPLEFAEKAYDEPLRWRSLRHWKGAVEHGDDNGAPRCKPLWYQAAYNLLRARKGPPPDDRLKDDALRLARAHLKALVTLERRRRSRWRKLAPNLEELRVFLSHLEATTLIMLARTKLETLDLTGLDDAQDNAPEREKFVEQLESPATEIVGYVRSRHEITDRAHYNLACLFSQGSKGAGDEDRERWYELALEELRSGLTPAPAKWLWKDKDLEPLRTAKRTAFRDIVEKYGPPELSGAAPKKGAAWADHILARACPRRQREPR